MRRLADRGNQVDVQILYNKVSVEFNRIIVDDWGATYKVVPHNVHSINIAEISILTFKAHLLS